MAKANINLLQQPEVSTPQQPVIQQITPKTFPAGIIRQRHLQAGYTMVKFGLAANRPITTNEIVLYFATDTFVMSYFNQTTQTWKSGVAFS